MRLTIIQDYEFLYEILKSKKEEGGGGKGGDRRLRKGRKIKKAKKKILKQPLDKGDKEQYLFILFQRDCSVETSQKFLVVNHSVDRPHQGLSIFEAADVERIGESHS